MGKQTSIPGKLTSSEEPESEDSESDELESV